MDEDLLAGYWGPEDEALLISEKTNPYWKTKDNREIRLRDMSDKHIRNTLSVLERKEYACPVTLAWIDIFNEELGFREYVRRIINDQ